jgi:hypothetical protein
VWSGFDDWEPAVAATRSSSWVYQMTTRYDGPKPCGSCKMPAIIFRSSSNGGQTWNADAFIPITQKPQNDPMIEVATDGAIYAVWLDDYRPGIKFMKSTNRGVTWSTPIQLTGGGRKPAWSDRPVLAISRDGRHVYIAFNASDRWVVASHDFGASFGPAVKTSNDTRYWFHTQGAVASNGHGRVRRAGLLAGLHRRQLHRRAALDQRRRELHHHAYRHLEADARLPRGRRAATSGFLGPSAGIAVDVTGNAMALAYNAGNADGAPQRPLRAHLDRRRRDVVRARRELSDPNPACTTVFRRWRRPAPGDFRLIWQDTRGGGTSSWNTWFRKSTNGGATWAARRRSPTSARAHRTRPRPATRSPTATISRSRSTASAATT